jgi:dTDP-4-dehydrorhamnose 3,5-epimerase-like enzyme
MNIVDTAIKDVKIFEPKVFGDERGFLSKHSASLILMI